MGVYIKGIEMPQNCGDCPCAHIFDGYTCRVAKRSFDKYPLENREDWCPLIEATEPHGRLIDADEFLKRAIGTKCFHGDIALMLEELVGESTTIIPPKEET